MAVVHSSPIARGVAALAALALLAGCTPGPTPTPASSQGVNPTGQATPAPTLEPSPTAAAPAAFPLAVVTGLQTLKAVVTVDELTTLAADGKLTMPCGVTIEQPALAAGAECVPADGIAAAIQADQGLIALLPPGLVEPATKVLAIAGDGPYGLFGPDLFGDTASRALPYPVTGVATSGTALDPLWTAYDAAQVWTMTNIGSLCADRWAAHQAVTLGKGWDWVFGGGTAKYKGPPIKNPNPPPGVSRQLWVQPVETGHDGVTAEVQRRADVAIADHECPVMPTKGWTPNDHGGRGLVFAVPEDVLTEWKDTLGLDAVYLAANHMSDRGVTGIRSTLKLIDKYGIPRTGLGLNLDEGLEPAYVEVAGLKVAFVAFNDVGGVARADADTAGVPWITQANIKAAVNRARAGGADVVICNPQWWGGIEYHDDLYPKQVKQLGWFDAAGCDHVIGEGTHVAGPMVLTQRANGVRLVVASTGNYMFGQDFWQRTQEGVISEQVFRGTKLVNVRLRPYVMVRAARAALTDPEADGKYVLQRIWKNSDLDYLP
jgi:hypothetical protein